MAQINTGGRFVEFLSTAAGTENEFSVNALSVTQLTHTLLQGAFLFRADWGDTMDVTIGSRCSKMQDGAGGGS